MGFNHLVNTELFSEAANDFRRNNGHYTKAPRGSKEYYEYWEMQEQRCMLGFEIGGMWIPGRMYFWLNFFQVYQVPRALMRKQATEFQKYGKLRGAPIADKDWDFPSFYEVHWEWWNYKHIAWNGGTFEGLYCPGGKHIGCAKTRGAGFSYLEACDGVYNYNFIPGSQNYYFASREDFLVGDAILDKVEHNLDFINKHIPFWKQNRQKGNSLKQMEFKASFVDTQGQLQGDMSAIMGIIVNDPNKTRGKRGRKITFEESGSFRNLKQALEISLGSLRDGASQIYVGQASIFGTGGEEGPSIEGLEDIFYNPAVWDMIEFPNRWEEGYEATKCGYFVPCTSMNPLAMTDNGALLYDLAVKADDEERDKKKKSSDPKALDRRKAEYPRKPSESFQRLNNNGFNIAEIDAQIRRVESNRALQSFLRAGDLIRTETGPQFLPNVNAKPILKFPHENGDDLAGAITILEKPVLGPNQKVPAGMYMVIVDPYYKEESESTTSLFSVQVWKQYNRLDPANEGLPVAWWAGRPLLLDQAYDIIFKLADYYNAQVQSEIAGGGQGIVDYARKTKQLHKIEFEPEFLHNKEIGKNGKNRTYFMNMATEKKILGLKYFQDWHMQQRGSDENGQPVLNIHRVYDLALLREMRKYNDKGNFDRVSTAIIAMYMLKENVHKQIVIEDDKDSFFNNRVLFGADVNATSDQGVTTSY